MPNIDDRVRDPVTDENVDDSVNSGTCNAADKGAAAVSDSVVLEPVRWVEVGLDVLPGP